MNLNEHLIQIIGNLGMQVAQQAATIDAQVAEIVELKAKLPKEKTSATKHKMARIRRVPASTNGAGESPIRPAVGNSNA